MDYPSPVLVRTRKHARALQREYKIQILYEKTWGDINFAPKSIDVHNLNLSSLFHVDYGSRALAWSQLLVLVAHACWLRCKIHE
jgi:hypothetical protein